MPHSLRDRPARLPHPVALPITVMAGATGHGQYGRKAKRHRTTHSRMTDYSMIAQTAVARRVQGYHGPEHVTVADAGSA